MGNKRKLKDFVGERQIARRVRSVVAALILSENDDESSSSSASSSVENSTLAIDRTINNQTLEPERFIPDFINVENEEGARRDGSSYLLNENLDVDIRNQIDADSDSSNKSDGSSFNFDSSSNEEGDNDQEIFEESFSSLDSSPDSDDDESNSVCSNAIVDNNDWEDTFQKKLGKWAVDSNVTRESVNKLLVVLREVPNFSFLPRNFKNYLVLRV